MYMFNYKNPAFSGGSYGINNGSIKQGIASATVNANGWPILTGTYETDRGTSFSDFFGNDPSAYEVSGDDAVNHLFLLENFEQNGEFYFNR